MGNWQEYWKAILAFLVPGAIIIGSAVLTDSRRRYLDHRQ